MATTLPILTRTIDNAFTTTWYEIRPEAIDNILDATVVWAALRAAGTFTPQTGGEFITRTIRHGEVDAVAVAKGDILPQGETETETMAIWEWKHVATHIQRDTITDQKNAGPSKIKDYVAQRLEAARDGKEQKFETQIFGAFQSNETGKEFQSLDDMVPGGSTVVNALVNQNSGTYGRITRATAYVTDSTTSLQTPSAGTNPWWGPKYLAGTLATIGTTLLEDLRTLYNGLHNNQSPPTLIIVDQNIFEIYEDFSADTIQIIKDERTFLADLGFEVLRFKGKPFVWTPGITANNILMLNTDFVEVVYDPGLWFDMTEWKAIPLQMERIAHIISALNVISSQLRRHGRLIYA